MQDPQTRPPPTVLSALAGAIVQTVRNPLLVLDETLRVLVANPAYYRTFRVTAEATEGRALYSLGSGQWDIPRLRGLLEDILPAREQLEDFEVHHAFPEIGPRTMLLNARRLEDPAGTRPPLILLAIEDVTERKQAEAAVRRYTAELERSNAALAEFASVASHDLQEPLRKVRTFGDRLARALGEHLNETARDSLTRMQDATARMQGLINDLLAYSRLSTGEIRFAPVDLDEVVRAAVHDLDDAIQRTGATVELHALPTLEADAAQMRRLFQNLLGNALKFRRPDEAPWVRVAGGLDDAQCVVTVADRGIGFDDEYAERIFGIFQRLHGRTEYEGSGIGLAICRKIVERHDGTIVGRRNAEGGATFTVTLPWTQTHEEG